MRGYGDSFVPDTIEAYRMLAHVADNVAVVRGLGADTAVIVGDDWGSAIATASAQVRPDLFTAVAMLGVPYTPRAEAPPAFPADFYVGHFQTPGVAEAEIESDVGSWLRRFYAALTDGTPGWFAAPMHLPDATLPEWAADFDAIAAGFERNGFAGPLNRYRNFTRDREDLAAFDAPHQPTVFISGECDSTRLWLGDAIERQARWLPAHTGTHVIPDCGHWVHQERPEQVNGLLLDFLADSRPDARPADRSRDRVQGRLGGLVGRHHHRRAPPPAGATPRRMIGPCSLASTAGSIVTRSPAISSSPRSRHCSSRAS